MESNREIYEPAFTEPPGTNLIGIPIKDLTLPSPDVTWGLPYHEACAKHVRSTFGASRCYVIASGTLSRTTDKVDRLLEALSGTTNDEEVVVVVGVRKGISPHTPWSEVLDIAAECREVGADCVVTIGAGSITDGAKLVVLVCLSFSVSSLFFFLLIMLISLIVATFIFGGCSIFHTQTHTSLR